MKRVLTALALAFSLFSADAGAQCPSCSGGRCVTQPAGVQVWVESGDPDVVRLERNGVFVGAFRRSRKLYFAWDGSKYAGGVVLAAPRGSVIVIDGCPDGRCPKR